MLNLHKWVSLGLIAGSLGCGTSTIEMEERASAPDTERSGALTDSEEIELRVSPAYDAEFAQAGAEFNVPASLLKALAFAQTRYVSVPGEVEFEGQLALYGVMGLREDQLNTAAELAGVAPEAAKTETLSNIRASAALLSHFADESNVTRSQPASWSTALIRFVALTDTSLAESFVRREIFGAWVEGVGAPSEDLSWTDSSLELSTEFGTVEQDLSVAPDYAGAVWRAAPNYSGRNGYSPSMVIIHTCEGAYYGCVDWIANPSTQASAHYVVKEDGREITQMVRENQRAWHISATYSCNLNGGKYCNRSGVPASYFTIGIEHGGHAHKSVWTSGMVDASAKLSCNISAKYGIPRDRQHYVGHGQLQPYNRTDPGPNWPWSTYMAKVNSFCGSGAPSAAPAPAPAPTLAPAPSSSETIVIDSNNDRNDRSKGYLQVSANWIGRSSAPGYYGTGYYYADTKPVADGAVFFFYLSAPATRTIDAWWSAADNRSTAAQYIAFNAGGSELGVGLANQTQNGGKWVQVGSFNFSKGWNKIILSRWEKPGKVVIADAIRVR